MKQNMQDKTAVWHERLRNWRDSGLTQAQFCREKGLALATFGCWKKKISEPMTPQFIPVSIHRSRAERVKLIIPGGVKITFRETSPLPTITAVLETLCASSGTR